MSKKKPLKTGGMDFSDDLSFPDMDFDAELPKDDRKPVNKILGGIRKGFTDSFTDESVLRRAVSKALPSGYGDAVEASSTVMSGAKELYDTAAKEVKPSVKELAKAADKLLPESSKKTKSLLDKIAKWADGGNFAAPDTKKSQQEYQIANELNSIFAKQAELNVRQQEDADNKDRIKDGLASIRHRDQMGLFSSMTQGISTLVQYQDKVTAAWQKKSLELQYRSYFVLAETLEEAKASNANLKSELAAITKNTGLPDYVKMQTKESIAQYAKNKFMTGTADALFGNNSALMGKIKDSLKTTVQNYARDAADAFSTAAFGADMAGMSKEMGADGYETGGEMVGRVGGEFVQDKIFDKIKGKLNKNEKMRKGGKKATYIARNLPNIVGTWAQKNRSADGIKGVVANFAHDTMNRTGPDGKLETIGLKDMNSVSVYTNQANKSITEIIPGYLSRIFRELQVIRTGDESIKLTTYDYTKNNFASNPTAKANAINELISLSGKQQTKNSFDSLFKEIDPNGEMSEEAKAAFSKQILMDRFKNKEGSAERYSTPGYMTSPEIAPHAEQISKIVSNHFGDKDSESYLDKQNSFNYKYQTIGNNVKDTRDNLQAMLNAGLNDFVKSTKLLNEDGKSINFERLIDLYTNSDLDPDSDTLQDRAVPGTRNFKTNVNKKVTNIDRTKISNSVDTSALQTSVDSFKSTYLEENTKILNAILNKDTVKEESPEVTSRDTLLRIEEMVKKGFNTGTSTYHEATGQTDAPKGKKAYTSLMSHLFDKGKDASKTAFGVARDGFNLSTKMFTGSISGAFKGTAKAVTSVRDILKDKWDIYIPGEVMPRILKAKLIAGEYRDAATGEVIRKVADIKGAVVDSAGNIVVKAEEVKDLFAKGQLGKKIFEVGKTLFNTSMDIASGINSAGMSGVKAFGSFTGAATNAIRDLIDGPGDVYIEGDKEPVLLGRIMRAGGYISQVTKKIIKRMSDVDGPVMDKDGNVLLTTDQLKKGIVDKNGNPIRSLFAKLGSGLVGMAVKGFKILKSAATGIYKTASKIAKGGLDGTLGVLEHLAEGIGGYSRKNNSILEKIYTLLDTRIPKRKSVLGDSDGDGLREGSWQENAKNKDKKTKSKETGKPAGTPEGDKPKRKNTFDLIQEKIDSAKSGLMSLAQGAFELFGNGSKAAATTGAIAEGAAGVAGAAKAGSVASKGGLLARTGSMLWKGAKLAGNIGLGLAGISGSTLATAATAVGGVASGALGLAGTIVGGIASGIGAIVSSPVILGALATAAVGYGAYKLYKYATTVTDDPMLVYRLAQYGFTSKDNDIAKSILEFESIMEKQVKFADGKATLSEDGLDYEKIFKIFGFTPEDEKGINSWADWFQNRFKPVFLTHQTALNTVVPGTRLSGVNKLTPSEKLKYFNMTPVDSTVYGNTTSPFPSISTLRVTTKSIYQVFGEIKKKLEEEVAKNPDKAKDSGETTDGAQTGTAAGAATKAGNDTAAQTKTVDDSANKSLITRVTDSLSKFATGVVDGIKNSSMGRQVAFAGAKVMNYLGLNVNALEAIRFRAYGLKDMDRFKVSNLREFEQMVGKGFLLNADGVPEWKGNSQELMDNASLMFGLVKIDKEAVQIWTNWFMQRFLPVYTAYRGQLTTLTGKLVQSVAEKSLKPEHYIVIGEKLVGLSIWSVSYSPWGNYTLNNDASGTQENLAALRAQAKESTMTEQKASSASTVQNSEPGKQKDDNKQKLESAGAGKIDFSTNSSYIEAAPDSESTDLGKSSGGAKQSLNSNPGSIAKASGPLRDGSGADKALVLRNAKLDGLHPDLKRLFLGMAQEYNELTGKTVGVNSAYRSFAEQEALYKKDPSKAAKPGFSTHESGLAIDVDSATLNEMDKLGLMRKYGFTRPVGNEPWHMEPIGIQSNLATYKQDPSKASGAITSSIGKGGGGWGTISGINGHGRNDDMSLAIYSSNGPEQDNTKTDKTADTSGSVDTGYRPASAGGLMTGANKTALAKTDVSSQATVSEEPKNGAIGAVASSVSSAPEKVAGLDTSSKPTAVGNTAKPAGVTSTDTPGSAGLYSKMPTPKGNTGWDNLKDLIATASKAVGVDTKSLTSVAAMESGFNANAKGSGSASGVVQFVKNTWNEMLTKYGDKFGIPKNTSPFDPKANILLGAQYTKDNEKSLSSIKSKPTGTDLYLAHLLGTSGANNFLKASGDAIAATVAPNAAKSNPEIFYNNGQPRTVAQVYSFLQNRINNKLSEHGVDQNYLDTSSPTFQTASYSPTGGSGPAATPTIYRTNTQEPPKETAPAPVKSAMVGNDNIKTMMSGPAADSSPRTVQNTKSETDTFSSSISSTLIESLTVQKQIRDLLQTVMNKTSGSSENNKPVPETNKSGSADRTPKPAPSVTVPMTGYKGTMV